MSWRGLEATADFQTWAISEGVQQVFDINGNMINDPFNVMINLIDGLGNNNCN